MHLYIITSYAVPLLISPGVDDNIILAFEHARMENGNIKPVVATHI